MDSDIPFLQSFSLLVPTSPSSLCLCTFPASACFDVCTSFTTLQCSWLRVSAHLALSHSALSLDPFGFPLSPPSNLCLITFHLEEHSWLPMQTAWYFSGIPEPFPDSLALWLKLPSMFWFSFLLEGKLHQAPVFFLFIFSFSSLLFQVPSTQSVCRMSKWASLMSLALSIVF